MTQFIGITTPTADPFALSSDEDEAEYRRWREDEDTVLTALAEPPSSPVAVNTGNKLPVMPDTGGDYYRRADLRDLLHSDDDAEPLVRGILYPGMMTTIGAWVGTGKTVFAMALVAALLKQERALGLLSVAPLRGHVAYFTELGKKSLRKTVQATIDAYELDEGDFYSRVAVHFLEGESILRSEVQDEFLEATRGAALVIIDTFDVWLAADANDARPVLAAMQVLKKVAAQGAAVLILDHQGKSSQTQTRAQSAVAGSSAKQRQVEMTYRLDRVDGPERYNTLEVVKDRHGDAVTLEIRRGVNERLMGLQVDKETTTVAPKIAAAAVTIQTHLRACGKASRTELQDAVIRAGGSKSTANRALDECLLPGERIERVDRGIFALKEQAA